MKKAVFKYENSDPNLLSGFLTDGLDPFRTESVAIVRTDIRSHPTFIFSFK